MSLQQSCNLLYKRNGSGNPQKVLRNFKKTYFAEHKPEILCGGVVCKTIKGIDFRTATLLRKAYTKEVFLWIHQNFQSYFS